jgi:hypothetical protein
MKSSPRRGWSSVAPSTPDMHAPRRAKVGGLHTHRRWERQYPQANRPARSSVRLGLHSTYRPTGTRACAGARPAPSASCRRDPLQAGRLSPGTRQTSVCPLSPRGKRPLMKSLHACAIVHAGGCLSCRQGNSLPSPGQAIRAPANPTRACRFPTRLARNYVTD